MAFNLSDAGQKARVSLGTGKLFLKTYDGSAPGTTNDIGYGRGGSFNITRQRAELRLGTPRRLIAQYAIEENVSLSFTGLEWNALNLSRTMGAGVLTPSNATGTSTDVTLEFGGDLAFQTLSARFIHQMPLGGTLTFDLYQCQGQGELAVNFTDDFHETPFQLNALQSTIGWASETLNEKGGLFRLRIQV